MSEQKHTPLPWYNLFGRTVNKDIGDKAYPICTMDDWSEETVENAEFIVRACNAHYDLIAALQAHVSADTSTLSEEEIQSIDPNSLLGRSMAALAKAKRAV